MRATTAAVTVLLAAALGALATPVTTWGGTPAPDCTSTYSYGGVVARSVAAGVAATIAALSPPRVAWGHVAAWVGVGGPDAGPHGTAEWLQVGISGFADGSTNLYTETALPGRAPVYTELRATVPAGTVVSVAVRELAARPDWWQVLVGGHPADAPVPLAGSHGNWRPMAMAESFNGGRGVCNGFRWSFRDLRFAAGGAWRTAGVGVLEQGDRVHLEGAGAFVAAA